LLDAVGVLAGLDRAERVAAAPDVEDGAYLRRVGASFSVRSRYVSV
jgi:hypothetical protein